MDGKEKTQLEHQIVRARDGIGSRIDELDRRLRTTLDVRSAAGEHAPELMAGGAVLGLLVGFGSPRLLKRLVQIAIPLGVIAAGAKKFKDSRDAKQQPFDDTGI